MKFQSIVASVLTIACSFCAFTSSAAVTETVDVSSLTQDQTKEINGILNMDVNFDLGTSTLTLTKVKGITGTGFFTGSEGSLLDI